MTLRVDVIVYGDFSLRGTSQAENMEALIEELAKMDLLGKVICRGTHHTQSRYVEAIPFGSFFPKVLTLLERIFKRNFRDFSQNILFDYFASTKISSPYVLASVSGLRRCLSTTQNKGGKYIEMVLMEHSDIFIQKIIEESRKLNIGYDDTKISYLQKASETMRQANYLVAISEHIVDTFKQAGQSTGNVLLCPLGIQTEKYIPTKKQKGDRSCFTVLCIAHFQIVKGLHYLLSAWEQADLQGARLIVGGTLDIYTVEVIKRFRHVTNITFAGSIGDTVPYYQEADVLVSPSLSEGFSKVVLEAMSVGVPVIITSEHGIQVTDHVEGFCVPMRDSQAIAEKLKYLYLHPQERKVMGYNARRRILRDHSLDVYKQSFKQCMETIMSENKDI